MKYEETELKDEMAGRIDEMENSVYQMLLCLLQTELQEAEKEFLWDSAIIWEVLNYAIQTLGNYGKAVCNPYRAEGEYGNHPYLCVPSECGCEKCRYQKEFMIKERIFSSIDEALAKNGYEILDGESDSVTVRAKKEDTDFQVCVRELPG